MYAVQKNIPIPEAGKKIARGRKAKYPFRLMKTGDSFAVPANASTRETVRKRLTVAACLIGKKINAKYATRATANAIRVWRVA